MKFISAFKIITYFLAIFFITVILFSLKDLKLKSFYEMIGDVEFLNSLKFGFLTSCVATFLSCLFGIPTGYYLARSKSIFTWLLDSFFDIPIVIPPLVFGVFLLNFFNNSYMENFVSFIFTFKGAVLAQFVISFSFTLKMSKSSFELVSPIYERIAMTLGAGYFKSFFDTTLKLSFNGILSGVLLSWLRSFGEFGATLLVAGGIKGKTENIPIYIYLNMMEGNYEKALAASFLTIFIVLFTIIAIRGVNFKRKNYE